MTDTTKHGLLCPVCRVDLMMTDRQGVEVDYCPKCQGVWLDRSERPEEAIGSGVLPGIADPVVPKHA